jgi:UDPglucose 6-dehydrogenase
MDQAKSVLGDVDYRESAYECADGAHALVIATEWAQFRALDFDRLRDLLACPFIVDLRNIYCPDEIHARGFAFVSVGRQARVEMRTLAQTRVFMEGVGGFAQSRRSALVDAENSE